MPLHAGGAANLDPFQPLPLRLDAARDVAALSRIRRT